MLKKKALLISAVSASALFLTSCDTDQLAEELSSTADNLLPNIWITIVQMLVFCLTVAVVFFFAYKPLKKKISQRQKYINDNVANSEKNKAAAEKQLQDSKKVLDKAQAEAGEIIKKAQQVADENAAKAQKDLAASIEQQKVQAHKDLEAERQRMIRSAHDEIVDTAISASKQILNREIDEETNRKLVDDFIDQLSAQNNSEEKAGESK